MVKEGIMTASGQEFARPKRRFTIALGSLLAGIMLLTGCTGIYLDPGPQAAVLRVPVKGQVTPEQRAAAALPFGGLEWANFAPRYNEYSEPLWDAQAFILAPDGGLHQLPPVAGAAIREKEGYVMDTVAEFLAPPGTHKLRVLFTCSVRRDYWDEYGKHREYLYLFAKDRFLDLTLTPGGAAVVEGLAGGAPTRP
jgi:hypothetical protein